MTTSIQFYHLLHTPLEQALPKLLERVLASGARALVRVASEADAERIAELLWTYDAGSFLPHGTRKDGNADAHPIYITAARDNPNQASILLIADGTSADDAQHYSKVLDLFDGRDEIATSEARSRWKQYQERGQDAVTLTYYQQQSSGGWSHK
jgi:DNA polymerase-3 subunit chi